VFVAVFCASGPFSSETTDLRGELVLLFVPDAVEDALAGGLSEELVLLSLPDLVWNGPASGLSGELVLWSVPDAVEDA